MKSSAQDQVEGHGEGVDGVGHARLEEESRDLAQQDGRVEPRVADRESALRELTEPEEDSAPEVPAGAEGLVTWDVSPEEAGRLMPEVPAEDEGDVSSELADEGRGEAEQELRRAAHADRGADPAAPDPA